jgi:hypothetical protein
LTEYTVYRVGMEGIVEKKGNGLIKSWSTVFMRFEVTTQKVTVWSDESKAGAGKSYVLSRWTDLPDKRSDGKEGRKNRVDLSVSPDGETTADGETVLALAFADAQKKQAWCDQFKRDTIVSNPMTVSRGAGANVSPRVSHTTGESMEGKEEKPSVMKSRVSFSADSAGLGTSEFKPLAQGSMGRGALSAALLESAAGEGGLLDFGGNTPTAQSVGEASEYDGAASEMDETRRQLEDLQIRTIFSLVEDIVIDVGGQNARKQLLFITNKQARQFDFANVTKVLQAMDVTPAPQLVINLFPSFAFPFNDGSPRDALGGHFLKKQSGVLDFHIHAERCAQDVHATDMKLMQCLEECVLPVAVQTNALVLVYSDECSLAHAFGALCAAESQKWGGRLPFTVMCIVSGVPIRQASRVEGTVTHALAVRSKRWKERAGAIDTAAESCFGDEGIGQGTACYRACFRRTETNCRTVLDVSPLPSTPSPSPFPPQTSQTCRSVPRTLSLSMALPPASSMILQCTCLRMRWCSASPSSFRRWRFRHSIVGTHDCRSSRTTSAAGSRCFCSTHGRCRCRWTAAGRVLRHTRAASPRQAKRRSSWIESCRRTEHRTRMCCRYSRSYI